jgi:hypothetical protein
LEGVKDREDRRVVQLSIKADNISISTLDIDEKYGFGRRMQMSKIVDGVSTKEKSVLHG